MKQPKFPHSVRIKEVGPRDGLQDEKVSIPSRAKVQLIRDLVAAGSTYIEATAFVSPQAIPQLADADRVARQLPRRKGVIFAALVPNMRGMERALAAGVDEVAVFTAASDSFNRRNINATIAESFDRFRPVFAAARRGRIRVRGYVSTAWECPYEGLMPPGQVMPVVDRLIDMGCYEVSLGDTIGHATPTSVWRLFDRLLRKIPKRKLAAQFHDTRSAALANTLAAMQYTASAPSTARSAASGGAPTHPAPAATSPPRISSAPSTAWE